MDPNLREISRRALTRSPTGAIVRCELTHLDRVPIDPAIAREQHEAYEACLEHLGITVERLPALEEHPDAVFVEDTAIVLPELAILTRPGASSRRGEVASTAAALAQYRAAVELSAPATLDGGDVLRIGHSLFVGIGGRTNQTGLDQLADLVRPFDYEVIPVVVRGCLHLKTAVSAVHHGLVLMNPNWINATAFARYEPLHVHPNEPFAANVLSIDGRVLGSSSHPRTAELVARHAAVVTTPLSELEKAEAGATCCSILL